jgi:hypothetical protein
MYRYALENLEDRKPDDEPDEMLNASQFSWNPNRYPRTNSSNTKASPPRYPQTSAIRSPIPQSTSMALVSHPPRTRQHPTSHSPAITPAPNRRKATANFCQHELGDRSMSQAIVKLGSNDGEGDHAWVRRRGSKRSYRHEGTRLCDRESKALVLAIAPAYANLRQSGGWLPFPCCGKVVGILDFACDGLGFVVEVVGNRGN